MEMYIYGTGPQLQRALNAVATFFTTNTFGSLVETALQLALVITATLFFFIETRNISCALRLSLSLCQHFLSA